MAGSANFSTTGFGRLPTRLLTPTPTSPPPTPHRRGQGPADRSIAQDRSNEVQPAGREADEDEPPARRQDAGAGRESRRRGNRYHVDRHQRPQAAGQEEAPRP